MEPILIVEDHLPTAEALKRILSHVGYAVAHVACGEAALEHLQDHATSLIVLDIGLGGIDGREVLRLVRSQERTAGVPVIIFSALADAQASTELLKLGANECLLKGSAAVAQILNHVGAYVRPPNQGPTALVCS